MTQWPIELIREELSAKQPVKQSTAVNAALTKGGLGATLVNFLAPLLQIADGAAFLDGAWRVASIEGDHHNKIPNLFQWNALDEWKQYAPTTTHKVFYFCSNSFGDQFGVPVTAELEVAADRLSVFWVEKYSCEISAVPWGEMFAKTLTNEDEMAVYLARTKEHKWASKHLRSPKATESFSWTVPLLAGGEPSIDNLAISNTSLHVGFTLQILQQLPPKAVGKPKKKG